ncbi:MAG: carbohydrate binding family 9 domain-containing protein [Armatimonadota bacterium]
MFVLKIVVLFLLILMVSLFSATAYAERPSIQGIIVDQPPKIDGDLSDSCWQTASKACDFCFRTDGAKADEETTAWICYDQKNIYVAYYCKDSQPEKIKCEQKKRGGNLGSDDFVTLNLDCYNNADRVVWFQVSAGGIQAEDLQTGDVSKIEWRGDWYAGSKRVSDGYTVEMQIPFSILKFDSSATCMGVAFGRQSSRLDKRWYSPDISPTSDARKYYLWEGLKLPKIKSIPLMLGYTLLGMGDEKSPKRFGLDIKHSITPTLTGLLTLSPDFRSIEQQVSNVDFSYTEQWQPDGRPFFQEGSRYFPGSDIFYTMRIVDLDFGTKLSGRYGAYDVGVMQSGELNGKSYSAAKVSRSWTGKGYVEMSGVRSNDTGKEKLSGVMAGNYRIYDKNSQVIQAYATYSSADTLDTDGAGQRQEIGLNCWGRPRVLGWSVSHRIVDTDYIPALGYYPEYGFDAWNMNVSIFDRPSEGKISYWRANIYTDLVDHTDGTLYYNNLGFSSRCSWRNGTGVSLYAATSDRPPDFDKQIRTGFWWGDRTLYRRGSVNIGAGKIAGGAYLNYSAGQGWDISDKMSINARYEFSRIKQPSPSAYSVTQLITTLNYDLSDERSLSGRFINTSGKNNIYIVYRQRVRSGLDTYIIFGDPNSETTKASIMLKAIRPI